jgi:hypothetical protein
MFIGFGAQAEEGHICQAQAAPRASKKQMTQGAMQVGEEILSTFATPRPYVDGEVRLSSEKVWQDVIHYPGATYIAPHFSEFELAPGDSVIIRSPDNSRSWRYEGYGKTEEGRPLKGGFWGIHIPGDTAIIELYSKGGKVKQPGYTIDKFARGFSSEEMGVGFGGDEVGTEAICGTDNSEWARCYGSTTSIYKHSKPVARLLINGTSACTGWLVGNQGHLLTNNHCISSSTSAANTDYEFLAEGATCTTSCASWGACPGTVVATSATLVKTDAPRDYTLLKLPVNPTATYGYLQLRSSGAVVNERIYIPQHPQAWGKKIAVKSTHSADQSGYAEVYSLSMTACQTGGPSDVGYYADTQGGSSGSPVIGYNDNQVVALHHCANCPNRGVPIQSVISHLGTLLPTCAVRSSTCPDPLP